MTDTLEFDSLELEFGMHRVLSSIYMRCEVGQVVGLLGRNGAGKSCLMKIVFGAMNATHKSVRVNGDPLPDNYLPKKIISYLPQETLLPSFLTIADALKLFEVNQNELISLFPDTEQFLKLKPKELSGGSLRIIETVLILKSQARFCILDEPFSGLMPVHIEKMKAIICEEKRNKGIIITDHLHRHVTSITDKLYLLVNGKTYTVKNLQDLIDRGYLSGL